MARKQEIENPFYENVTLGLCKLLRSVPHVSDVYCEQRHPCDKVQVVNWESRHGVYLPEDMKKFYLSTDGFILHWSYQYAQKEIRRVGHIHFPHLLHITPMRDEFESPISASLSTEQASASPFLTSYPRDFWGNPTPNITPQTKIFELNHIGDIAKMCMLYESVGTSNPKFYLFELQTLQWQFLSDTFSEYLRMAIAHLGLPYWELCFSTFGIPAWAEQIYLLLAPHLLDDFELRRSRIIAPSSEMPHNALDPDIFRATPRSATKKKSSVPPK